MQSFLKFILLTACSQAVSKPVWHIPLLCVQWKTHDDGQGNHLKHVEFYSKNKFEKLVHLVGFIIRIYHDARSPECQIEVHLCHLMTVYLSKTSGMMCPLVHYYMHLQNCDCDWTRNLHHNACWVATVILWGQANLWTRKVHCSEWMNEWMVFGFEPFRAQCT